MQENYVHNVLIFVVQLNIFIDIPSVSRIEKSTHSWLGEFDNLHNPN